MVGAGVVVVAGVAGVASGATGAAAGSCGVVGAGVAGVTGADSVVAGTVAGTGIPPPPIATGAGAAGVTGAGVVGVAGAADAAGLTISSICRSMLMGTFHYCYCTTLQYTIHNARQNALYYICKGCTPSGCPSTGNCGFINPPTAALGIAGSCNGGASPGPSLGPGPLGPPGPSGGGGAIIACHS